MAMLRSLLVYLLAVAHVSLTTAQSGTAISSRYWDCCKPSCGWKDKAKTNQPVRSCDAQDEPLGDFNAGTGCNGGDAWACSNQTPWAVNDTFSYGFVGAFIKGGSESSWCCSCYEIKFLDPEMANKTMIVQASNTDYDDPTQNVFTFAIPGGNNSFSSCGTRFSVDQTVFGDNKIGVASKDDCNELPEIEQDACRWRFDWLLDVERPNINFTRVACPATLTDITGCIRDDEKTFASSNSTSMAVRISTLSNNYLVTTAALASMVSSWLLV